MRARVTVQLFDALQVVLAAGPGQRRRLELDAVRRERGRCAGEHAQRIRADARESVVVQLDGVAPVGDATARTRDEAAADHDPAAVAGGQETADLCGLGAGRDGVQQLRRLQRRRLAPPAGTAGEMAEAVRRLRAQHRTPRRAAPTHHRLHG